jgi:gluconolactonase
MENAELLATGLRFPEGPVAMADGSVLFVEIEGGWLSRVDPSGERSIVATLGGGPNGAARGPDGAIYVCNNGRAAAEIPTVACIQRVEVETGAADIIYTGTDEVTLKGPNDLVFDSTGGFWFTDYSGDAIYYAQADGSSIELVLDGVPNPNGIGLSPDGAVLYWAQTHTRQVMRRRLSGPGQIIPSPGCSFSAVRRTGQLDWDALVVGLPGAQELDSLAVESSGAICVGTLVDSGISIIAPDGSSVEKLTLPEHLADVAPTNICFGGPDLRTAYITLSQSGRLISCTWPRPGLRLPYQE